MEHPILRAIQATGFQPLGWFAPRSEDGLSSGVKFIILIGNAGPDMFRRFARDCDTEQASLDDWTVERLTPLAQELSAQIVFPFDEPAQPFLRWGIRSGAGHASPLGLNLHPLYGLWHAYRAALLFPVAFDLPALSPSASPCLSCVERPCLSACPVSAFTVEGYDVAACADYLLNRPEAACLHLGCLARHACPVGQAFAYAPRQAAFFMRAFVQSRRLEESAAAET